MLDFELEQINDCETLKTKRDGGGEIHFSYYHPSKKKCSCCPRRVSDNNQLWSWFQEKNVTVATGTVASCNSPSWAWRTFSRTSLATAASTIT